jgi:glycine dehydrogenase subunit 1
MTAARQALVRQITRAHRRAAPWTLMANRALPSPCRPGSSTSAAPSATSNICTNQGLLVTAATIHLALLGAEGLARVAAACHANTQRLSASLCATPGVEPIFDRPCFHEQALRLPVPAADVLRSLAAHNILAGFDLGMDYPELGSAILVCATELRAEEDIAAYSTKLARVIATRTQARCPVEPKF